MALIPREDAAQLTISRSVICRRTGPRPAAGGRPGAALGPARHRSSPRVAAAAGRLPWRRLRAHRPPTAQPAKPDLSLFPRHPPVFFAPSSRRPVALTLVVDGQGMYHTLRDEERGGLFNRLRPVYPDGSILVHDHLSVRRECLEADLWDSDEPPSVEGPASKGPIATSPETYCRGHL